MHTVFHFFHLALLVLVSLVRGRLLWVHSIAQEINVGLLLHLSSTHPSRNISSIHHVRLQMQTHQWGCLWHLTCCFSVQAGRYSPQKLQETGSDISAQFFNKENLKKGLFSLTLFWENLWFHGVDYFSSQSLKDKAQGHRDCSPFSGTTKELLS